MVVDALSCLTDVAGSKLLENVVPLDPPEFWSDLNTKVFLFSAEDLRGIWGAG